MLEEDGMTVTTAELVPADFWLVGSRMSGASNVYKGRAMSPIPMMPRSDRFVWKRRR